MAAEDGEDFRVRRLQEHVASFDAPGPVDAAGVADSAAAEAWLSDVARETLRRSARPINVFFDICRLAPRALFRTYSLPLHFRTLPLSGQALDAQGMAALLPCMWRRAKYCVTGLKKAAHYNDTQCVVLGTKPDSGGGRIMARLLNTDASELLLKRVNLRFIEAPQLHDLDPQVAAALERLSLCASPDIALTRDGLGGAARNFVQGLFDVTFAVENQLVDAEFQDSVLFAEILSALSGILGLCISLSAVFQMPQEGEMASEGEAGEAGEIEREQVLVEWLGEGMAECVHWRKGALIYMATATSAANKKALDLALVDEGLREFDAMIATRTRGMAAGLDEAEGSDAVRAMIASGILSDTHLLAVVYSGEMCYWAEEAVELARAFGEKVEQADRGGGYRVRGQGYLKRYLTAVETMSAGGPGSVGYGWDTKRASDLLAELESKTANPPTADGQPTALHGLKEKT